jgi:hypothetical protein
MPMDPKSTFLSGTSYHTRAGIKMLVLTLMRCDNTRFDHVAFEVGVIQFRPSFVYTVHALHSCPYQETVNVKHTIQTYTLSM